MRAGPWCGTSKRPSPTTAIADKVSVAGLVPVHREHPQASDKRCNVANRLLADNSVPSANLQLPAWKTANARDLSGEFSDFYAEKTRIGSA